MSLKKPSAERASRAEVDRIAGSEALAQRKLVLDLPTTLHKRLKQAALDRGVTMRALVIEWLEGMKQ